MILLDLTWAGLLSGGAVLRSVFVCLGVFFVRLTAVNTLSSGQRSAHVMLTVTCNNNTSHVRSTAPAPGRTLEEI